jgi:hypothetical protein
MQGDRLAVDGDTGLLPIRDTSHQPGNRVVRALASLLSYVFHPLFIPVYLLWFLMNTQPQLFAGFDDRDRSRALIMFFVLYTLFPLVTVLLSKGLGFVKTIQLKSQKDRIIPYLACEIYYFWMAYVLRHQPQFAPIVAQLAIAIFLAASAALIINIYIKVSMHAISLGVALAFIALLSLESTGFTIYMSGILLVTGLVCTARMIVSDHFPREIYIGLLTGVLSMIAGVWADGFLP